MNKILSFSLFLLCFSSLSAQHYYTVKFPDDITVTGCGAAVPSTYPDINHQSTCSFGVGVSVKDQIFYTNELKTCGKIFRKFRLNYWCDYNPNWLNPLIILNPPNSDVGATATGNAQNHGFLEYTQIIKFLDDEAPVFIDCPTTPLVFCDYSYNDPNQWHQTHTDFCEGKIDLKVKVTDGCSKLGIRLSYLMFLDTDGNGSMETQISSSDNNAWQIETVKDADTLIASVKFPPNFEMIYGKHKLKWIANDDCGNITTCEYGFEVKDCAPPTVVCHHGLSANIMPTGMLAIWDVDFVKYAEDNCTPANQLKLGIRKAGLGTGFPLNQHGVTFTCSEIGQQFVEIWAADAAGNAGYCLTYLTLQDPFATCAPAPISHIKGSVFTPSGLPLAGVKMRLQATDSLNQHPVFQKTDSLGAFVFSNLELCKAQIAVQFEEQRVAGLSALDLLMLDKYLDTTYSFSTPYEFLAADLNLDGQINLADWQQLLDAIIQPNNAFTSSAAWQFLPKNFQFLQHPPIPNQVPQFVYLDCEKKDSIADFFAIKKGDLDFSANNPAAAKGISEAAIFTTDDKVFAAGDRVEVLIKTPNLLKIRAFQISLEWSPEFLFLENIVSGLVPASQIAIGDFKNQLIAAWAVSQLPQQITPKNPSTVAFTIVFRANVSGRLSDFLKMNEVNFNSEAYTDGFEIMPAVVQFDSKAMVERSEGADLDFDKIGAVRPNPAVENRTELPIYLTENQTVTIALMDIHGRVLQEKNHFLEAGYQVLQLDLSGKSGLVLLKIKTANSQQVQWIRN